MSWEPGRERVRELIDAGEVEQVTPDLIWADARLNLGLVVLPSSLGA